MRRTGICGALETLLIDAAYPGTRDLLAAVAATGCELRGDDAVRALSPDALPATAEEWDTEYLEPVLSAAVVDGPEATLADGRGSRRRKRRLYGGLSVVCGLLNTKTTE